MPKYSRMQRYQVLRDRLEEETTEAQQVQNEQPYQRLSRVANKDSNGNLSHANNPHKEAINQTVSSTLPNSPVMDHLIDEVRQYNLDQGNSVWDDTQISILKQLDGTQSKHRNQHFVPLEQQQENLGSTMQLPVTKIKEVQDKTILQEKEKEEPVVEDKGPTILPMSEKPLPMYPLEEEEPEENFDTLETKPVETNTDSDSDNKIILSSDDFVYDELEETFETLSSKDHYKRPGIRAEKEPEQVSEKPAKEHKPFFNKKEKKAPAPKAKKAPVKKEAVKKEAPKKPKVETKPAPIQNTGSQNTAGKILNIVLAVLIVLLVVFIIATVIMMRRLAA